jgi:pyruvate,water dikinase
MDLSQSSGGNEWLDIAEPKASSQVLTNTQVLELAEIILHIEKHYGFPCDIEWAYEGGKFYVVQRQALLHWAYDSRKI